MTREHPDDPAGEPEPEPDREPEFEFEFEPDSEADFETDFEAEFETDFETDFEPDFEPEQLSERRETDPESKAGRTPGADVPDDADGAPGLVRAAVPVPFAVDREEDRVIAHTTARKRHGRRRPRIALNLTPMIDVTFLLLVYFMVATQFRLGEEVYRLDLPNREGMQSRDPFDLDDEPLRIRIATTGYGLDAYRVQLEGPYRQPRTFEELHGFLDQRRIRDDGTGGIFAPEHPIIIEPTRTTIWQHALGAFNAAARAQYTNVTLGKPG